jgi:GntP family gluconate:H+ symporter
VMLVAGTLVGLATSASGLAFAVWANRRWDLPLRETDDFKLADAEAALQADERDLPPFWLSVLPVLLPVLLIAGLTILKELPQWGSLDPTTKRVAATLGEKNVALALAAAIGLVTLIRQQRQHLGALADSLQKALASAGVIILITAAGGAFGTVLRETGVEALIRQLPAGSPQVVCLLAFLVTVAIRTAQGSATVAMITAVGLFAGIDVGVHPVYLALAIGCGSKPFAWMNDSGFWVITRMSGMTEAEGLKFITPMTALMGFVGLAVVLLGATVLPTF